MKNSNSWGQFVIIDDDPNLEISYNSFSNSYSTNKYLYDSPSLIYIVNGLVIVVIVVITSFVLLT